MADNTTLPSGSGGDVIRDKDRAGVKTQIVGLDLGIGGSENLMNGSMPITSTDGAQTTMGATTDVKVTGDNTGSLSAKLRGFLYELGDQADAASLTGSLLAKVRQLGVLLNGGLPAALAASGALKNDTTSIAGTATDTSGGNKSAGTQRVTLATDQTTLTNLLAQIAASGELGTIYNGTTALTPKFKTIVASASGATTVVAAVASKKLTVLSYVLVANAAVNVKWQSSVTPTDISGLLYLAANGGVASGHSPTGHFQTIAGEALNINLSGAVAVGGHLVYVEV